MEDIGMFLPFSLIESQIENVIRIKVGGELMCEFSKGHLSDFMYES
jgi:hypothetical protein